MSSEVVVYSGIGRARPCAIDPKDGLLYLVSGDAPGTRFPDIETARAAIGKTVAALQTKYGPTGAWIEQYSTTSPTDATKERKADFRQEQAARVAERTGKVTP